MQVGAMHPFCGKCHNCRDRPHRRLHRQRQKGPGPDGYYGNKRFADYVVWISVGHPDRQPVPPAEAGFWSPSPRLCRA